MEQTVHAGDYRELLVAEIYKAAFGATAWSHLLGCLCELTHSDRAFAATFDLSKREARIFASFNAEPQVVALYNGGLGAENPWLAKSNYFQSSGLVWRGSRIVSDEQLATTRFFRDFLLPQAIRHTLHLVVDLSDAVVSHVILVRGRHEPDFGSAEIEVGRCFIQHAQNALTCHRESVRKAFVQKGLSHVIDDAALGVAIVDPPNVVYMSETCERLLADMGAMPKAKGPGAFGRPTTSTPKLSFPRAVADAVSTYPGMGTTRLILTSVDRDRKILVDIRSFVAPADNAAQTRMGLAVTFYDLEQRICVDEALLQEAYELTASEARICSLLVNGERVEDLSERLKIRPNTARTHIKRIFGKTGSTRQAELVKLVMRTATLRNEPLLDEPARRHASVRNRQ